MHIPVLKTLDKTFEIVAICSRTQESLDMAQKLLNVSVDFSTDAKSILEREDIDAVDILMPIDTMPEMVHLAFQAGKHVISEKPMAPDVASGRRLLEARTDRVWMVAENFRYEDALLEAARIIQSGEIGKPVTFHWDFYSAMTPGNLYYRPEWRHTGAFPGGFLMDGGVHVAAGLRLILGEIQRVNATIIQVRSDLPPADTMSASLVFDSGVIGSWNMTYAYGTPWPHTLHIACERGAMRVDMHSIEVVIGNET